MHQGMVCKAFDRGRGRKWGQASVRKGGVGYPRMAYLVLHPDTCDAE